MKPLHIFTFKATNTQQEVAAKWAGLATTGKIILHRIPQQNPIEVLGAGDVVVTFGQVAASLVRQAEISLYHAELPSFACLSPGRKNETTRAWAKAKLERLSSPLEEDKEIEIKRIDIDKLEEHEGAYKDMMGENIFLACKSGEILEINQSGESKENMAISFTELFAVQQIINVLDVEQVRIVRKT